MVLPPLEAHSTFAFVCGGRLFIEMTASSDHYKTCELPDEDIIIVGAEDFHFTEVLLQPSLLGKGGSGDEVRH